MRSSAVFATAFLLGLAACSGTRSSPTPSADVRSSASERATEPFRRHHVEIREHFDHIDAFAAALPSQSPEEQRRTMNTVVAFLTEHIAPHAADEEFVLYPVVARRDGEGSRVTAVMIHEHRIVERSIEELRREAAKPEPDAARFARTSLHLMGLLYAHFECEEEVLLPVLDRTMSAEQFQSEVADRMPH